MGRRTCAAASVLPSPTPDLWGSLPPTLLLDVSGLLGGRHSPSAALSAVFKASKPSGDRGLLRGPLRPRHRLCGAGGLGSACGPGGGNEMRKEALLQAEGKQA